MTEEIVPGFEKIAARRKKMYHESEDGLASILQEIADDNDNCWECRASYELRVLIDLVNEKQEPHERTWSFTLPELTKPIALIVDTGGGQRQTWMPVADEDRAADTDADTDWWDIVERPSKRRTKPE